MYTQKLTYILMKNAGGRYLGLRILGYYTRYLLEQKQSLLDFCHKYLEVADMELEPKWYLG